MTLLFHFTTLLTLLSDVTAVILVGRKLFLNSFESTVCISRAVNRFIVTVSFMAVQEIMGDLFLAPVAMEGTLEHEFVEQVSGCPMCFLRGKLLAARWTLGTPTLPLVDAGKAEGFLTGCAFLRFE